MGDYTYQWSNGGTDPDQSGLLAGDYTLTVTNAGGCSVTATVTVGETPADFIVGISTVPGNCLGEGADIIIELQTPGEGPMEIVATGPDGMHTTTAPEGSVNLGTSFIILPGSWTIVVRDLSLPERCTNEVSVEVEDNTEFTPQDDTYETFVDQPVSGNVLDNDSGLGLAVQDHTDPAGGTLVLNSDGTFTFTPPPGATGEFTFQYQVVDSCGNSAIVNVTITVNPLDCMFEVSFAVTPANCGLENGAIHTMVVPPGTYTYIWSSGETSPDITDLLAAQYTVTVTSTELMCSKEYVIDVPEIPNTYITDITTMPGNCTGEGEITITLETPGDGPLIVIVNGPEGETQLTLPPGTHDLSSSLNIPSGDYTITVYDQGAGEGCTETMDVTVPDNTPALVAVDDLYETAYATSVTGNVLDNDTGLGLTLTDVTAVSGGIVDWNADGSFTFTPDDGFSGTATFEYTVTDACGNTATALVIIEVAEAICDFTVEFTITNASCGFEDGAAFVAVNEPGTYFYIWDNGESGPLLQNVAAGTYSVTIEDVVLGCELVFSTDIGENPADYISDIQVIQPSCPEPGEILFTLSSPGGGPFEMTVTHPGGVEVFDVPAGQVALSDYVPLIDGDYLISVIDVNAGPQCEDSFDATLEGTAMLEIAVEAIIPPTEFSSMDGAVIVVITMPTMGPYTIYLDGDVWGVIDDGPTFTIEGLGVGTYDIQIQDVNGCFSNLLTVDVPPPPPGSLNVLLGFGFTSAGIQAPALPENPSRGSRTIASSFVDASLLYRLAGLDHENRVMVMMDKDRTVYRVSQMVKMWDKRMGTAVLKINAGISADIIGTTPVKQYWTANGRISKRLGKYVNIHAAMTILGWEKFEYPSVELGCRFNLTHLSLTKILAR
jgi:hypothetical protein